MTHRKSEKPKPVKAWAVWSPNCGVCFAGVNLTRAETVTEFCAMLCSSTRWPQYYKAGYRCIRVLITEIRPKKKR